MKSYYSSSDDDLTYTGSETDTFSTVDSEIGRGGARKLGFLHEDTIASKRSNSRQSTSTNRSKNNDTQSNANHSNSNENNNEIPYEWKDAFIMFDKNRDGTICVDDIPIILRGLGKNPTQGNIEEMLIKYCSIEEQESTEVAESELDGSSSLLGAKRNPQKQTRSLAQALGIKNMVRLRYIDFPTFCKCLNHPMRPVDSKESILDAFKTLDPEGSGSISVSALEKFLIQLAEPLTYEEVQEMLQNVSTSSEGTFNYEELVEKIFSS